jgi:hypothetical protein
MKIAALRAHTRSVIPCIRNTFAAALVLSLASCTPATYDPSTERRANPLKYAKLLKDYATTAQVLENVKAAQSLQTLPPSVAKNLTADDYVHFDSGFDCKSVENPSEADYYGQCAYGNPRGQKLMVLYGDSHAEMWYAPLERIAAQIDWKLRVFSKHACPSPEMRFRNPNTQTPDDKCDIFHSNAPEQVTALHPDLVLTTSVSNWYLPDGTAPTSAQWRDAWVSALRKLSRQGTRLALIGDVPYWAKNDSRCLAARLQAVQECSVPTASATTAPTPSPANLAQRLGAEQEAAAAVGAAYVSTVPWICADRCEPVIADMRVFADETHLSASYVTYLTGAMTEALEPVMVP